MIKFFEGIHTMQDLKKTYWQLAKVHHPDAGGDTATMQEINAQYEAAVKWIQQHGERQQDREDAASDVPAEYMDAVAAAVNLGGVTLEMVGMWIWATGNTYEHREALKAAGYHFAGKRRAWYWRPEQLGTRCKASRKSFDELRWKYGAFTINGTQQQRPQLSA